MKTNTLILSGLILTSGFTFLITKPANASVICLPWERNCTVDGVPEIFKVNRSDNQSCIATFSSPRYFEYFIENATNDTVNFKIGSTQFSLSAGEIRNYKSQISSGGSNSCSSVSYGMPTVSFDSEYAGGYQGKTYTLQSNIHEYIFRYSGNGINFYYK